MSRARSPWLLAAGLAVAAVGGTVGAALASHQFSDVGDGSPFHDAIANVNDAGCVSGFPEGDYRPRDNVRRQQAAYWLDACLGRGDAAFGEGSFFEANDTFELELAVEAGGLPDVGTGGRFLVLADVDVDTSGDQQSTWTLEQLDSPNPGEDEVLDDQVVTVLSSTNPDLDLNPSDGGTLVGFVPVQSAAEVTFRLTGVREGGVPLANLSASLTAVWLPFAAGVAPS